MVVSIHVDSVASLCDAKLITSILPDPRSPQHRRQAFDLGDAGAGATANNLSLGCDCLGTIHYFDGYMNDSAGEPVHAPNVICLHEQVKDILDPKYCAL